ncbi:hypothetical protein NHG24_02590 [Aerococcaceae bacterium NML210727]|nr:hypothetical protein [Aerococcaceae bacterium NML210727]MCW6655169.1 hypothetical protein [Aerococcaceae bacterium NML201296]
MAFFNQANCLWLTPQSEDPDTIHQLLEVASPIQDKLVPMLDPVYIMNVVAHSPVFRSLILTHTGKVLVSTRSVAWVAEAIFERQGFRYDTWNEFWQNALALPRKTFPYVNGRTVYVKVTRGMKETDWLNVSQCVSMDMWTTLYNGEATTPCVTFYFRLKQCEQTCLGVRLSEQCAAVARQLGLAIQLREAWHRYYESLMARRLPEWVVEARDDWQERFALLVAGAKQELTIDPEWLEVFHVYNTIWAYVERGKASSLVVASELLAHKSLDRLSLNEMRNKRRKNGEEDTE